MPELLRHELHIGIDVVVIDMWFGPFNAPAECLAPAGRFTSRTQLRNALD
jgi:hypothetical protein